MLQTLSDDYLSLLLGLKDVRNTAIFGYTFSVPNLRTEKLYPNDLGRIMRAFALMIPV